MKELTLEITDWCPHECEYCSTDAGPTGHHLLSYGKILDCLRDERPELVHISGGEPLSHPSFWSILHLCCRTVGAGNVIVHTNALRNIAYNASVIPGVKVHAYLTPDDVDEVHVVKRVVQGREAKRPVVKLSRNYNGPCGPCEHRVVRPDGTVAATPCRKDEKVLLEDE